MLILYNVPFKYWGIYLEFIDKSRKFAIQVVVYFLFDKV